MRVTGQCTELRDQSNGLPDDNHNTTRVSDVPDFHRPHDPPPIENLLPAKRHDSVTLRIQ
ncbi:hypothetical protein GGI14_005554 [Coemansia sp. S680]|nr:hypothetical protein GGI14_005554 [Coemansia sp. S680]